MKSAIEAAYDQGYQDGKEEAEAALGALDPAVNELIEIAYVAWGRLPGTEAVLSNRLGTALHEARQALAPGFVQQAAARLKELEGIESQWLRLAAALSWAEDRWVFSGDTDKPPNNDYDRGLTAGYATAQHALKVILADSSQAG